jgi:hypothetical protein
VTVDGAYFAVQGDFPSWTTGVRVHGYRDGQEIAETDWFTSLSTNSAWFAINLHDVDRIVVESVPVNNGGGWFGMDDLTYTIPEPSTIAMFAIGAVALLRWRHSQSR